MIKKKLINELINNQDITVLERHLIFSYITNKKLDYSKSLILNEYFQGFENNASLLLNISTLNILTIKELENYLEIIIPKGDRKLNGAFFTPEFIVNFIINELKPENNHKNLDPSCGCGAFLIGLAEYYKLKFNKSIRDIVRENIFGSDILEYNIRRTKLILSIYALQHNEILLDDDFNLYNQDSLKVNWNNTFDNVVGNPPYVKFQDLSDENREYLSKNWTTIKGGSFNLYFAFFELGYKLLKSSGKLGYITPNNYFTSLAGESIRNFFHSKQCVTRIVDFSHKKVFDALTYTAITFINKGRNETITYDRIKTNDSPELFLKNVNGSINYLKNLNSKKWRLLKSDEQNNILLIENIGTPIGKLFEINAGIATLKDEVYFVNSNFIEKGFYIKHTDKGKFKIEKEITRPVYKISDFKGQEEISHNTRRIICPYNFINGNVSPISESAFKEKFPFCYEYLLSEKEILASRDKGKVKYEPFYVWGRTQGLSKIGKKLINPTFSQYPRFLLVEEEISFFTNGYGLFFKKQETGQTLFSDININPISSIENIDVVKKILNSYLMHYYVTKTSVAIDGGYPCYQKNFIEKFSIPDFSQDEINLLRELNDNADINEFLISKYGVKVNHLNLAL